uniref:AlNc14C142G7291 protein n=1 Tax=Albugo laibachii Nc14 TaxID=890382 RepID=F0WLA3_9STRA|nr:AlNc14C142G7291 [Albugo laibachii Nc14]|eukprot:CCA22065.1 AlNc14C142G7291 [Albugo laibachii Nc14]
MQLTNTIRLITIALAVAAQISNAQNGPKPSTQPQAPSTSPLQGMVAKPNGPPQPLNAGGPQPGANPPPQAGGFGSQPNAGSPAMKPIAQPTSAPQSKQQGLPTSAKPSDNENEKTNGNKSEENGKPSESKDDESNDESSGEKKAGETDKEDEEEHKEEVELKGEDEHKEEEGKEGREVKDEKDVQEEKDDKAEKRESEKNGEHHEAASTENAEVKPKSAPEAAHPPAVPAQPETDTNQDKTKAVVEVHPSSEPKKGDSEEMKMDGGLTVIDTESHHHLDDSKKVYIYKKREPEQEQETQHDEEDDEGMSPLMDFIKREVNPRMPHSGYQPTMMPRPNFARAMILREHEPSKLIFLRTH